MQIHQAAKQKFRGIRTFSLILILFAVTNILYAQDAFVRWSLTNNQKVSKTSGPILGEDETLSGMSIYNYSYLSGGLGGNSQLTTINGGYWPADSAQNNNRYIQFAVTVKSGITFGIDTVRMYYTGRGGHLMSINAAYSTDSAFKSFTLLNPSGAPIVISDNSPTLHLLVFKTAASISYGQKFYLRIYPWYPLNLTTKYVCLQNVVVSGSTSGSVIPLPPLVSTIRVTDVSTSYATAFGEVLNDGDAKVAERGFCWNEKGTPTISDSKITSGSGTGGFSAVITGLLKSTRYYVRAYAVNSAGTSYGEEDTVTTRSSLDLPVIVTSDSIKITGTSVYCGGDLTDWGGSEILRRGICYNRTGNPTVDDSTAEDSTTSDNFSMTIYGLSSSTNYFIRAFAQNGLGVSYGDVKEISIPAVLKGAFADGVHKDTRTIQSSVDSCSSAGGGTVKLANGIYYTAPFELKSNVTLEVDSTAEILASSDKSDYYPAGFDTTGGKLPSSLNPLISSNYADNITITGSGTIDGNGKPWWDAFNSAPSGSKDLRPYLIILKHANHLTVEDITLKNSPKFHLAPQWCSDVLIKNVKIKAPSSSPNTDGIDPATCHHVKILNCWIDTGDDNVAIKSGNNDSAYPNAASSDILVSGCTFIHGHGVSIGSETNGGVDSMTVDNCTFDSTDNGIRIKSDRTRGGNVRRITYSNLSMKNVTYPILFTEYYPTIPDQSDPARQITNLTPYFHDITVKNLKAVNCRYAGIIIGLPETPMKKIVLDNVSISALTGLRIRHATVDTLGTIITASSGPSYIFETNGLVTGMEDAGNTVRPNHFSLMQNYPNPFNPSTTIRYEIPSAGRVVLKLYDILGREAAVLVDKVQQPGTYNIQISAIKYGLSSGIYIYRLIEGNYSAVKKLVLIK